MNSLFFNAIFVNIFINTLSTQHFLIEQTKGRGWVDLWMTGTCRFHVGLRVSERWWCCVYLCHIKWIHTHLSNGWEPDTCQSRHSSVAQYRHTTAASFAPFPWHPARASGKHSLLPSGVSVQTSNYWTQQWEFGRRENACHFLLFLQREPIPQWCKGVKTPIAAMLL